MTKAPAPDEPRLGLVIRYSYLWRDAAMRGQEEGVKDRPCVVVLATQREGEQTRVYVAPVTHTPPARPEHAIEIPAETKRRLGLDDGRSWIVTTELNAFTWPGYDLRPVNRAGGKRGYTYGVLPRAMTADLVRSVRERQREGQLRSVGRDPEASPARPAQETKRSPLRARNRDRER